VFDFIGINDPAMRSGRRSSILTHVPAHLCLFWIYYILNRRPHRIIDNITLRIFSSNRGHTWMTSRRSFGKPGGKQEFSESLPPLMSLLMDVLQRISNPAVVGSSPAERALFDEGLH